jgi:hypothetical protein
MPQKLRNPIRHEGEDIAARGLRKQMQMGCKPLTDTFRESHWATKFVIKTAGQMPKSQFESLKQKFPPEECRDGQIFIHPTVKNARTLWRLSKVLGDFQICSQPELWNGLDGPVVEISELGKFLRIDDGTDIYAMRTSGAPLDYKYPYHPKKPLNVMVFASNPSRDVVDFTVATVEYKSPWDDVTGATPSNQRYQIMRDIVDRNV